MYKLTPECWIRSHGPQICASPFHQGALASGVLNHQDDNEGKDEEEFPALCHHTMGKFKVIQHHREKQGRNWADTIM